MASWRTNPPSQHPAGAGGMGAEAGAPPVVFAPDLHDGRHLRLKGVLLLVWALVSFGVCFFARDLQWMVAGWPVHYWMASQGALLVFMAIVVVYAAAMSRFERQDARAALAETTEAAAAAAAVAVAVAAAAARAPATAGHGRAGG